MPVGCTLPDDELRSRARERIDSGRLPLAISTFVDAAFGTGNTCRLCDEPITREHVEYEVRDRPQDKGFVMHLRCHQNWQLECIHRMWRRPAKQVQVAESIGVADRNLTGKAS